MADYFKTDNLAVGYGGNILIRDICLSVQKGKILTLIGPNGAGKSTILKSIIKNIAPIKGCVRIDGQEISQWSVKEMARKVAVVLTERIRPELMTCGEVVAMGRYPYTNMLGRLTAEDHKKVRQALQQVHGEKLANQDFLTTSDGQRQRIMLARAICQEPEVIVLDEPTAFLDIRHKVEFLEILRKMAREKNITVIMSLHEVDLAAKISDYLVCVKGETIENFGPPEKILQDGTIEKLYDMEKGAYNLLFGSVELEKPSGNPQVFVVAGNGKGIPYFRMLQKKGIPFVAGILFENDVDYQVAKNLSNYVVEAPAFEPVSEHTFQEAMEQLHKCQYILDAGTEIKAMNHYNGDLIQEAERIHLPKYSLDV